MVTLDSILIQLINGIAAGMLLVMLSLGLSIIFGMLRVINFAHGTFYMWGAYAAVWILGVAGNFWVALLFAPIIVGIFGMGVERTLLRRLYKDPPVNQLLLTFGLTMVMTEIVRIIWGPIGIPFNTPRLFSKTITIWKISYPSYWLFIIGITGFIVFAMWYSIERSMLGAVLRAGIEDTEMTELLGVDISRAFTFVFGIGTALAGLTGVLAAPLFTVIPDMGTAILLQGFVVVIIGGLGNNKGVVITGLILGELTSFTTMFEPTLSYTVIFIFMAIVLVIKPGGLFEEKGGVVE